MLPTKRQHLALETICEAQRQLYNAALQERIDCYRKTRKSISYFDQCKSITICRSDDSELAQIPVNLQRATLKRIDEAFKGFFRRLKNKRVNKGKAGFPRFKSLNSWGSFGFSEFTGIRFDGKRLRFKGLPGSLRVHLHRPLPEGEILACIFKKGLRGWEVGLQIKFMDTVLPKTGLKVGIDVGLTKLAVLSNGQVIKNPRHTKRAAKNLRIKQRILSRRKKGSKRRKKARLQVAKCHAKIANSRNTYLQQITAAVVKKYDFIGIEDLNLAGLTAGKYSKHVHDAAWGKFRAYLTAKAERAGRILIAVDPRGTTQDCHHCGNYVKKTIDMRWHLCDKCGASLDRDHNSALEILRRASLIHLTDLEDSKLAVVSQPFANVA